MAIDFRNTMRSFFSSKAASIIIVTVVMQTICILFVPRFATRLNAQLLLRAIPSLGIVSIGVSLLMIAQEFDLSVGSTFALASLIMTLSFKAGLNIWLSFLLGLIAGCFVGAMNGLIVIKTRIPSFIATLGTMMIWRGAVLVLSGGAPITFLPGASFKAILSGSIGAMPVQFIWFVGVAILFWMFLENHKFGNSVFATGGNKEAAKAIGINTDRAKLACFMIVGATAALAGCMEVTRISSVFPIQGQGLELQAIAASVVGGTSLMGGEGTILGTFLGATIIYTIQDLLLLLRAPAYYLQLFVGILIIIAVIFNVIIKRT